jgi:hypothetical protein
MEGKERGRVLSRNFTGWLLSFGELQKRGILQIPKLNEPNCQMEVVINGKRILITLSPDTNTLSWMNSPDQEFGLSALDGNGWSYLRPLDTDTGKYFEIISSPLIDIGTAHLQIQLGKHPDKGAFVSKTLISKSS